MKWLATLLLLLAPLSQAADIKSPTELRAALIFQLSKVVYFPPEPATSAIRLCLLHGDGDEMAAYFNSRKDLVAQGKPFQAHLLSNLTDTSNCTLLYIDDSTTMVAASQQLQRLSGTVVTIGDDRHFLRNGGLMSLIDDEGRVSILVNRPLLQSAAVRLPSRVLALARFYPE